MQELRRSVYRKLIGSDGGQKQALREAVGVALITLILVAAAILGLWTTSRNSITDNFRHYVMGLAQVGATLIDPQLHNSIRRPEQLNDADYTRAVEPLRRMCKAVADIHYVYTLVRDGDTVHFVLDAADPKARNIHGLADQSGVWQPYLYVDDATDMFEALGTPDRHGRPSATLEPISDEWGTFMTGFAPIFDSSHQQIGIVGVDVDATVYVARLAQSRNRALLGLAPAGLLIVVFGVGYYRVRLRGLSDANAVLRGVEEAKQTAERLAQERWRLSAVIEGTNVGTWEWHAHTRLLSINERWAGMLGYSLEELMPCTSATWRGLAHPDDLLILRRAIAGSVQSAERMFVVEFRMRHRDGRWLWVLARGKITLSDARGRPRHVVGIVMDVSTRKAMESALMEAAQRDRLTGLPNRTVFMEHLERTLMRLRAGTQRRFAVLFLDFDRFKLVNDTLGHEAGDELLRQIGVRLQSAARFAPGSAHGNLICRFGGDEFLVLINDLRDEADAVLAAQQLLKLLAPAYRVFGREVHSLASIGIVSSDQALQSAEEIVRNADVAMYEAKRFGRGRAVVFNDAMHARLTRHVTIENDLRKALGTPELYLEYQPIVALDTGQRTYVEALLRWKHPTMGMISPSEFTPIAEESGLIVAVGQWVLEEACRAMVRWRAADPEHAPRMMSVNVSRAEIALGAQLLERVRRTLEATELPPGSLQLEVTEREVMRDPEAAREVLGKLRELGVRLAMDDFGTGTSSLSLLRGYPFDTIKIDRSFLQDLHSSREVLAVIHATVNLIQNLSMVSLAEGVEDATQVAILQSLGCHFAQGYFFSRPVSEAAIAAAMAAERDRLAQHEATAAAVG